MQSDFSAGSPSYKIDYVDPRSLRTHPLREILPMPAKDSPEWHAFLDGIEAVGVDRIPAILITQEGFVIDGEKRRLAAVNWQWEVIPAITCHEWEVGELVWGSLMGQRSLPLGGKVMRGVKLWPAYEESALRRQREALKSGLQIREKAPFFPLAHGVGSREKTSEAIAKAIGCGKTLVEYGREIDKEFESDKKWPIDGEETTFRDYYQPRIDDPEDPMPLGRVRAGIGGIKGDPKWTQYSQDTRFFKGFSQLRTRSAAYNTGLAIVKLGNHMAGWDDLEEKEQEILGNAISEYGPLFPQTVQDRLKAAWKADDKRRRNAARRRGRVNEASGDKGAANRES